MTVDWIGYHPFETSTGGSPRLLPRKEARSEFARLMEAKADRIKQLRDLVAKSGIDLDVNRDESIQDLNDWFRSELELEPEGNGNGHSVARDWYPVILDIGLFLGEAMLERCPSLHWEFFTRGKKNVAYQSPLIMGFSDDESYNIDPPRLVATYAHRIAANQNVDEDAFWKWVRSVEMSC